MGDQGELTAVQVVRGRAAPVPVSPSRCGQAGPSRSSSAARASRAGRARDLAVPVEPAGQAVYLAATGRTESEELRVATVGEAAGEVAPPELW